MELAIEMEGLVGLFKSGRLDMNGFLEFAGPSGLNAEGVVLLESPWIPYENSCRDLAYMIDDNEVLVAAYAVHSDFVTRNKDLRIEQEDRIRRAIDVARQVGTNTVLIYGGSHLPGVSHSDGMGMVVKSLKNLVDEAKQGGVILAVTNGPEFPSSIDDIMYVISRLDSAYVRPCIDTGGFLAASQSPVKAVNEFASSSALVRLSDMSENGPVPVGTGNARSKEVIRELTRHNYKGYLSVYAPDGHENPCEFIRESAKWVREMIGKVWR